MAISQKVLSYAGKHTPKRSNTLFFSWFLNIYAAATHPSFTKLSQNLNLTSSLSSFRFLWLFFWEVVGKYGQSLPKRFRKKKKDLKDPWEEFCGLKFKAIILILSFVSEIIDVHFSWKSGHSLLALCGKRFQKW